MKNDRKIKKLTQSMYKNKEKDKTSYDRHIPQLIYGPPEVFDSEEIQSDLPQELYGPPHIFDDWEKNNEK